MNKVIGVKFKDSGKIYYFDPLELEIEKGGNVIVETARGLVFGEVAEPPRIIAEESIVAPLKPVVRVATDEDREQHEYYLSKEKEAFKTCQRKIEEHGLAMKLVDVEYAFNGSKLSFYFTADNRVDFRELVKDLAGIFKTRIDLRQIGVRDEAKKCGGIGACGRPVCCSSFLTEFIPVSIKMAKSQNLSLNPTKISGICGRLMCCLKYEQECYDIMHKQMPTVGTECVTVDGSGVVIENNVITERTKVKVTLADGTLDVRSYPFNELNYVNKNGVRCCGCDECGGSCCGKAEGDEMPQQAASKPDSANESEKEAELIDEPKYDRADIYSDDEVHFDETEKGDGELPAAKPAKHVKFSKPSNFQKTAKSAQNGNRVQKHSQGGDSGRKFNKKQNKRQWTPRSKSSEMLEHEDEFDGVEKGDRPDRPGGGFKKQQKPAKFKKKPRYYDRRADKRGKAPAGDAETSGTN